MDAKIYQMNILKKIHQLILMDIIQYQNFHLFKGIVLIVIINGKRNHTRLIIKLQQAKEIALKTLEQLKPYCERIEIAGSIRREKPEPNDIEIVAIPKPYDVGLFESGIATVVKHWQKVKGELPCKYTQRILPDGIKLDLFFATPENWGLILAIRTGSADYSHKVLASTWVKLGYKSEGGILQRNGKKYPVREEIELFKMLGLRWIEPKHRVI